MLDSYPVFVYNTCAITLWTRPVAKALLLVAVACALLLTKIVPVGAGTKVAVELVSGTLTVVLGFRDSMTCTDVTLTSHD